jgi:GntR family transcriptional regulator
MRTINRHSDRPAYKQLADILRDQIMSGELAAGTDVPSEAELARANGISRNSVKQAMNLLRNEGLIVSARGRLSRVRPVRVIGSRRYLMGKQNYGSDLESSFAREHGVPWSEFDVDREYRVVPAPARVASALHIAPGTEVYERRFLHATGGIALRVSWSYLPAEQFTGTVLTDPDEPLWPGGTIGQLTSLGINVTRVRTEVTARAATVEEAEMLGLPASSPVLEAWRTQLAEGEPIETAQHVYPPNGQLLVFDVPVARPKEGGEWEDVSYD